MDILELSEIKSGTPGITPVEGMNLYENCIVALHRSGHPEHVVLQMDGLRNEPFSLVWEDCFDEQLNRTYADEQSVTERGAIAISAMLALKVTDYTIIERSRKGTGFDYMLGNSDKLFIPKARLEVSGIMRQVEGNTLDMRFRQKANQTNRSDDSALPAFISIVEFSIPKAKFDIKQKGQ